jgi:dipeptidyl aminopeptidase/acylaminoacyl peptidase
MPTFARKALSFTAPALLFSLTVNLSAQSAPSEPKRDPRIDSVLSDLGKVRIIYQTAISPDGETIAWVVAGEEGGKRGGTEIEVAPLATPENPVRITAGNKTELCDESSIAWSPDSKSLAFLSDCADKSQSDFYLAQPGSKTAPRRLTHLHGSPESPAFSPNGNQIGFLYVEGATRRASPLAAEKPPSGVIGEEGLEIKGVWRVGVDGGRTSQVTPAALYTYEFDWSPDAQQIAYVAAPPPGENNWWVAKLYTQHLTSDVPTTILDPVNVPGPLHGLQIAVPSWSPDGKQIAFIGGLMSDQGATGGDIFVVSAAGGSPEDITSQLPWVKTVTWIRWHRPLKCPPSACPMGSSMLISRIVGGSSEFGEFDEVSGEDLGASYKKAGTVGDGRMEGSLSLSDTGDVAFIQSSFGEAAEVWTGPLIQSKIQLTHYNDKLKPAWGKAESITWTSPVQPSPTISSNQPDAPKDFNVQGWLLYPANYDPTKKYPLIVSVHGGPSAAELPHWPYPGYGPVPFAALGYFVLMPNPRGSYGQGEAFVQANRKDFGYGDLRDILAGVDAVTHSHNIDPERVGLTGWSYGGFMTMFAVTQTNRFRAAVAGAGISNWQSYYGENSIDQWMTPFMGASVYDDPGVYAKMSAVNYIHQVRTPTLAVVGDRDGECPAPQSFEFWHALKAQHVPTQLVVYPNEGHGFVNPEHQSDVIARALGWFEKYMPAQ